MFTVNNQTNRISPVKTKTFGELGFTERKHLQEWLAYQPDALGEELLVIQKEFDGFDDTRERLDLLALDKDGNLVIIENKLDDSGRDVVWQALKYASYCASLTKLQIVEIYQQYLNRYEQNTENSLDAASRICEFLEAPDLDETKMNLGNSQRLMLVAANFRKEVTSTALWLIGQGISIQCFKVIPYALGEQLFLNIDQIIPTPEAKELMIGINAKEAEEKNTEVVVKNRHKIRRDYWQQLLDIFQESDCSLYNNVSAGRDHWLSAGSGFSGCPYTLIFLQKEIRVELSIGRRVTEENKFIFDFLFDQKEQIESNFGDSLKWMRLDDKKMSRIQYSQFTDGFNRETWDKSIEWHLEKVKRLENTFSTLLQQAAEKLKLETFE
ncbi:DUF4268 domain-containing protein [Glaciecola sp. 2405UD65-10]|uniref:DUF4268 domain-containing protein n=1 Tax=Glaciecola sp. 2405UD65-10 TaxID=3397244 RepID=UPI003B5905B3